MDICLLASAPEKVSACPLLLALSSPGQVPFPGTRGLVLPGTAVYWISLFILNDLWGRGCFIVLNGSRIYRCIIYITSSNDNNSYKTMNMNAFHAWPRAHYWGTQRVCMLGSTHKKQDYSQSFLSTTFSVFFFLLAPEKSVKK